MAPVGPVQTYAKLENNDSSREHPDHFRLDTSSISNPPNPSLYSKPSTERFPMTLKEILLQELETADDALIADTLTWVQTHKHRPSQSHNPPSIVEFFRNSPLCEFADEIDLSRDQSPIPDRITL